MVKIKAKRSKFLEREVYRFLVHKTYLDKGLGLTNYLKYLMIVVGVRMETWANVFIVAVGYAFVCYLLGMIWIKGGFAGQEAEVSNNINPFFRSLKKFIGIPDNRKI